MPYIKSKVNQTTLAVEAGSVVEGDQLNAEWLNHIQTQLEEFNNDYGSRVDGLKTVFFKKTVIGNGSEIQVQGALVGNPVIYVNGTRKTSYEASKGPVTGLESFYYDLYDDTIYADGISINGLSCTVFYYSLMPHKETHYAGGADAFTVSDIGGLTQTQIEALLPSQFTAQQMKDTSKNFKESNSYALCVRTLNDGQGANNEIYDTGL